MGRGRGSSPGPAGCCRGRGFGEPPPRLRAWALSLGVLLIPRGFGAAHGKGAGTPRTASESCALRQFTRDVFCYTCFTAIGRNSHKTKQQ